MLETLLNVLLLLPPLAACVWVVPALRGAHVRERKVLMMLFVPLVLTYFVLQNMLVSMGHYPFWGAKFLHDLVVTLLVPIAYMMVRLTLGVTSGSKVVYALLSFLVLMIPDVCMLVATPFDAPLPGISDKYNYLQFHFTPELEVKQSLFSFVVVLQVCLVLSRVQVMRRIFIMRDLYLSDKGRLFVRCCLAGCGWILITLLATQEFLSLPGVMLGVNAGYSVLITTIVVMVGKLFDKTIVVNRDNEPVDLEGDADSDLAEGLRLALERDKVYLNNSLRIEELSLRLSSNRTYVTRICRLKFGMSFTELVNYYRVEHAKQLMSGDARKRLEEVATESGFSSASFFAKVFKMREGITPSQWRLAQHEKE